MVTFNHVSFSYAEERKTTKILDDLTFHIIPGSFTAIIGPSGCGKSTILSLIYGLYKPNEGQIILNDKITKSEKIGYMLQSDHLLEWRTIFSNVCLGLEIQKKETKERLNYANELLDKYGLKDYKKEKPSALSGGMRQRVALIRTLVLEPELLLLDEPFSALDFQTRIEVSNDIYEIIKSEKKTAILVTHDISEAISLADTIIVLSKSPCQIKKIVQIESGGSKNRSEFRSTVAFQKYFDLIWEALQK